jgi:hypothetical protein
MVTPKHLIAMARSRNTAACGNVRFARAKNDARRWGAFLAETDNKYRPKAPRNPQSAQVSIPGRMPDDAIA